MIEVGKKYSNGRGEIRLVLSLTDNAVQYKLLVKRSHCCPSTNIGRTFSMTRKSFEKWAKKEV